MIHGSRHELTAVQHAAIARLFSANVVRELATVGKSAQLARLASQTGLLAELPSDARLRDLFEAGFAILSRRANRHEYVYKNALARKVLLGNHSLKSATMLTEFRVGECKADVVLLNGTSVAYEIKTERDSLSRLQRQLSAYLQVFDLVNVVIGLNHVDKVRASIPGDVGILVLSDRFQLSRIREARSNTSRLVSVKIFEILRRREAQLVLERCGGSIPELPNTQIYSALREEFERLDSIIVHRASVEVLKTSRSALGLADLLDEAPASLATAILSANLTRRDRMRLAHAMDVELAASIAWARN